MDSRRPYNSKFINELLKELTDGLTLKGAYVNGKYLGKLSNTLRIKVEFEYENSISNPVVGVNVYIINVQKGCIDEYYFDFGVIWGGSVDCRDYYIYGKKGWDNKEPTKLQLEELIQELKSIVFIYGEEF